MSVTCGFYNSLNHDRKYDATQMSSIFDGIIRDGIFMSIGTHLSVTAGEGMFVTVGEGKAWFNHTWTLNDAELPLAIEVAELVLDRIDAVVLEVDSSESVRNNTIKVIKGTPSSEPERPVMEDTETLHQYPLAYISVKANATQITTSDITNMIGTEATPFITGILETIDITSLVAQWESQWDDQIDANQKEYDTWLLQQQTSFLTWREDEENTFEAWRIENQTEFEEWFQNLKNQLDENQATHLQNQIDGIKDELKVTGGSRVVVTIDDKKGTIKVAGLTVTLRIDGAVYTSVVEENKTATFAGILEIGVAEIECNDSTQEFTTGCTLEIPCYSYYEATTVKVDMYEQWLLTAGYTLDDYPEVSDIVNDYEAMYRMMNLHATVDYLVRWYNANNTILSHFTTSEVAMRAIGENDYAADALMAIPAVNDALLGSEYWEYIFKALVPVMTSDTTPYGEVIYDSQYGDFHAYKVFSGTNTGTLDSWISDLTVPTVESPHYIGYKSQSPNTLKKVQVVNRNSSEQYGSHQSIKDVIVQGSNNGSQWDDLVSHTNDITESNAAWEIDVSSNTKAYLYYRLLITSMNDTGWIDKYVSVGQLQFYGRQLHALVPTMTSNTEPSGEVSASDIHDDLYQPYQAFDNNDTTIWLTRRYVDGGSQEAWLKYKFPTQTIAKSTAYTFVDGCSFDITLQGSNDDYQWNNISNDNINDYLYYRIYCTNNTHVDGYFGLKTLQLYGPSYEETVGLAVPGDFKDWLEAGGYSESQYENVEVLLEDEKAVRNLMTKADAVDSLVKWLSKDNDAAKTILEDSYVAKWTNYREYAYSSLSAVESIKAIMDATGKYGMYITVEKGSGNEALVPTLTSNTGSDGGEAFCDTYHSAYYAWKPFSEGVATNVSSCWYVSNQTSGHYVGYKFVTPTKVKRIRLSNFKASTVVGPKTFKLQASNDNSNWTDIGTTVTFDETDLDDHYWTFENDTAYFYYRIYILTAKTGDGGVGLCRLQFYGYQFIPMVPTLTSNNGSDGGVAFASSIYGSSFDAYKAFDGSTSDSKWVSSGTTNQYVGYEFINETSIRFVSITNETVVPNQSVQTFKIQYSDDNSTWNDATEVLTVAKSTTGLFGVPDVGAHLYWRVYCLTNYTATSGISINELQFYGAEKWQPKGLVPVMTSNTAPYGEVSASSVMADSYAAFNAFNNNTTGWVPASGSTVNSTYIQYRTVNPICLNGVKIQYVHDIVNNTTSTTTATFKLQGSNDGTEWNDIKEGMTVQIGNAEIYHFNNPANYIYYRIIMTNHTGTVLTEGYGYKFQFYGRQLEALVPPMTSNTAPVGEVIYSSEYSSTDNPGWKAFDGKQETGWLPKTGTKEDYVGYKFQSPVRANMMYLCYGSASYAFDQTQPFVKVQASNDNSEWIDLSSQIGLDVSKYDAGGHLYVDFDNDQEYLYYRASFNPTICVTNSSTDFIAIHTLQFYGTPDYDSRTYIYDHGVDVTELETYVYGTDSYAIKESDYLYVKIPASTKRSADIHSKDLVDLTNYNFMYCNLDLIANGVYTPQLSVISTIPFYHEDSYKPNIIAAIAVNVTNDCNTILDISTLNNEYYLIFYIANNTGAAYKEYSCAEWWLE